MKKVVFTERRKTTPRKRDILANIALFRSLSDAQLDSLADGSLSIRRPAGVQLVQRGDAPKGFYVVVYGQVRMYLERADGAQHTLAIFERGGCFGMAETFLDRPHLSSVTMVSDAMVILTAKEQLFGFARENPGFTEDLLGAVAHQSYCAVRDIKRQTGATAKQRLAGYLLRQSERQSNTNVELNTSKTLLASRIGVAAESFSRLLRELSTDGLIEVCGRQIRILDAKRLDHLESA